MRAIIVTVAPRYAGLADEASRYATMACAQLGRRDEARAALDEAVRRIEARHPRPGHHDLGSGFHDVLFCALARREAETLRRK